MNNKFRYMAEEEILRRQLELLAESSEKAHDVELCGLSSKMIEVYKTLNRPTRATTLNPEEKEGYMDESRETEKKTIDVTVEVNADEAMEKTEKLIALLVTANSLADELAVTLSNLKLDIKI